MFGKSPDAAQAETTQEGIETMADAVTEVPSASASLTDQVAALQATVTALTDQLNGKVAELADKDSKIAELTALVNAATEFKAAQEKAAAEAKVAARTAKLAEVVGTEQATSLQAALATLDDAAFDVAVGAMSNKLNTEAKSAAFNEVGVEGSTDAVALATETSGSRVMDYLKTIDHNQSN
jgi:septal ring factor EnvC (AmiA/AmiB activator)